MYGVRNFVSLKQRGGPSTGSSTRISGDLLMCTIAKHMGFEGGMRVINKTYGHTVNTIITTTSERYIERTQMFANASANAGSRVWRYANSHIAFMVLYTAYLCGGDDGGEVFWCYTGPSLIRC